MFKTKEQISKVSKRTGVSHKYIKELGIMMSRVKLAQEDLDSLNKTNEFFKEGLHSLNRTNEFFTDMNLNNSCQNLKKAIDYFENDFLKCKLW